MSSEGFLKALVNRSEIEITTVGRRSGKDHTHPVGFVQDRNKIYLLPVAGSKSQWFKNIQARARMSLIAGKNVIEVDAKPHTDEKFVADVRKRFEDKYGKGEIKKYFKKFDAAVELTIT